MTPADLDRAAAALAAFHTAFAPFFGRTEARTRSEQFLRGLLVQQTDRRNAENLAEAIPGASPRALQRFLTEAPWDPPPRPRPPPSLAPPPPRSPRWYLALG